MSDDENTEAPTDGDDERDTDLDAEHPELPRGSMVGRYTVLGSVARSQADVVYGAYDPTNERKVAIKLIRITETDDDADRDAARERMLEEAEAIAQLRHPCVVEVLEVGTLDDHIFLALEFLDGIDLRAWMEARDEPFPWPEVLRVFREAGRGLAAAHRRGIVHRDFSPSSVLLCKGGRICVLDFGLGREATPRDELDLDVAELESSLPGLSPQDRDRHRPASITRRGLTLGTPHYMAPEVHISHRSDAKSDQFSFCVALYEALYGERPFPGNRPIAIAMEAVKHNIRHAPPSSNVPPWLREIVVRGLHPRPEERWRSMDALLRELARDPAARRRRWALGAAVVGVLGAGAYGIARQVQAEEEWCAPDEAALAGIWDAPRRSALGELVGGTGRPWADDVWSTTADAIDRWASEWTMLTEAACVATRVRGEATEELWALRKSCLADQLRQVEGIGRAIDTGSTAVLDGAYLLAPGLTSARVCTFSEDLESRPVPAQDDRDLVASLSTDLATAEALRATGDMATAVRRIESIVAASEGVAFSPLRVDALLALGRAERDRRHWPAAAEAFHAAAALATRDDLSRPLARAWLELAAVTAAEGDAAAAGRWADYAEAVIDRRQYARLRPRLAEVRGDAAAAGHAAADAIGHYYQAIALEKQREDGHPLRVVGVWRKLGNVLMSQGDPTTAVGHFEDGLATLTDAVGAVHPALRPWLRDLARAQVAAGETAAARASLERAVTLVATTPDPLGDAETRYALGQLELDTGDAAAAIEQFATAASLVADRTDAGDLLARALHGSGRAWLRRGKPAKAVDPLRRAVAAATVADAPDIRARARFDLARAMWFDEATRADALELAAAAQRDLAARDALPAAELAMIQHWIESHSLRTKAPADSAPTETRLPPTAPSPTELEP